jgi:hypothetical protein
LLRLRGRKWCFLGAATYKVLQNLLSLEKPGDKTLIATAGGKVKSALQPVRDYGEIQVPHSLQEACMVNQWLIF